MEYLNEIWDWLANRTLVEALLFWIILLLHDIARPPPPRKDNRLWL